MVAESDRCGDALPQRGIATIINECGAVSKTEDYLQCPNYLFGEDLDVLVFATYLMNWSDACSTQTNRTDIYFATYASFSVVAFFHACLCVYSGIWLRKWQMNPGDLSQVWPDLRAYCRLTLEKKTTREESSQPEGLLPNSVCLSAKLV